MDYYLNYLNYRQKPSENAALETLNFHSRGTRSRKKRPFSDTSPSWPKFSSRIVTTLLCVQIILGLEIVSATGAYSSTRERDAERLAEEQQPSRHTFNPESGEDTQYYDDDPGVVFVAEEENYDDGTPYLTTSLPVLQREPWKLNVEDGCPPSPQSMAGINASMCAAKRCISDLDCGVDGSFACCYNGCLFTCTRRVDPPPAFDWVEETEVRRFNHSEDESTMPGTRIMAAEVMPETIALPGGCFLNREQFEHLKNFRKYQHVTSCGCEKGDVVCHIKADVEDQVQLSTSTVSSI